MSDTLKSPEAQRAVRAKWEEQRKARSRERVKKMLDLKKQRDQHDAIPSSRRRWDVTNNRWIDDQAR